MRNNDLLDKLLPVPTLDEVTTRIQAELGAKDFPVTNFQSGGVFAMAVRICAQLFIELKRLARVIVESGYVHSAKEGWLELRGEDYGRARKEAQRAQGVVTLTRTQPFPAVRITKGHIFKTPLDAAGESLSFEVLEDTVLRVGQTSCDVAVQAERPGALYNLPPGTITQTLVNLESVEQITNREGWLTREGSDLEALETYRARINGVWSTLAATATSATYRSVCESVAGVLHVRVDDLHPRGQGTVDIIVTSTAGEATPALLAEVEAAAQTVRGPYDDLLVNSSVSVPQAVAVTLQISSHVSDDGFADKAKAVIAQQLAVAPDRNLNELLISDIVYSLRAALPLLRNVVVTTPVADVRLAADQVVLLGELTVTVERL